MLGKFVFTLKLYSSTCIACREHIFLQHLRGIHR